MCVRPNVDLHMYAVCVCVEVSTPMPEEGRRCPVLVGGSPCRIGKFSSFLQDEDEMDSRVNRPQRVTKLFDMVANIKEMMQEEFAVECSALHPAPFLGR